MDCPGVNPLLESAQRCSSPLFSSVRPTVGKPASHNKSVAASAHFVRSREHGAGAPRRQLLNVMGNRREQT